MAVSARGRLPDLHRWGSRNRLRQRIGYQARAHRLPISLPWWSFALGIGFSATIGISFGMWPAFKASAWNQSSIAIRVGARAPRAPPGPAGCCSSSPRCVTLRPTGNPGGAHAVRPYTVTPNRRTTTPPLPVSELNDGITNSSSASVTRRSGGNHLVGDEGTALERWPTARTGSRPVDDRMPAPNTLVRPPLDQPTRSKTSSVASVPGTGRLWPPRQRPCPAGEQRRVVMFTRGGTCPRQS